MSKINTINIYAAGGAGANIAKSYIGSVPQGILADVNVTVVDTSRANLQGIPPTNTFLIPIKDGEGSGKVRAERFEEISANIPSILQAHPPEEFNIVVFSAAGGSGSVIGPLLHAELLRVGKSAVTIAFMDDNSVREITNTNNTLLTCMNLAKEHNKPYVASLISNTTEGGRSTADDYAKETIASLAMLFSGTLEELDKTDLKNFLNFAHGSRNQSLEIGLAQLSIFYADDEQGKDLIPLSVAMIHPSDQARVDSRKHFNPSVEYVTEGYARGAEYGTANLERSVVFATSYNTIVKIFEEIKDNIDTQTAAIAASSRSSSLNSVKIHDATVTAVKGSVVL